MVKNSKQSLGSIGYQPKSNEELDAKAQQSARVAVIPETDKRTKMKIYTMQKWLTDRAVKNPDGTDKKVMDPEDFSRFLESHVTKKGKGVTTEGIDNGSSAHSWRTAWKKWRALLRMDVKKDDPGVGLINLQVKGKKYKAGQPDNTSPDVIDSGRLHNMVSLFMQWEEAMYAIAFLMIFYGGFRKTRGSEIKIKGHPLWNGHRHSHHDGAHEVCKRTEGYNARHDWERERGQQPHALPQNARKGQSSRG